MFSFFRLWRRTQGFKTEQHPSLARRRKSKPSRLRAILRVEELEVRTVPSQMQISGFVYHDANNNGLFDPSETPLANVPIELRNASNTVIASTVTDANGRYVFTTDNSIPVTPSTKTYQAIFAEDITDWTKTQSIPKFDSALGTLTKIEIAATGSFTSNIAVENMSKMPAKITGTVSGVLNLTGPGAVSFQVTSSSSEVFNAAAFDGVLDLGGASGHDFGQQTTPPTTKITTLTAAADMAPYIGTGTVTMSATAQANSTASGAGNLVTMISSTASAQVVITYHYIPNNNLLPGTYIIVQPNQPAGYLDGKESSNGVAIPNTIGTDTITVTLVDKDSTNNNFGELKPAGLSGAVYVDSNNNGIKEAGEAPISGVTITLIGTDDTGKAVNLTQLTGADGFYLFNGLRPGTYTLVETQPNGYLDGKDTLGSAGGGASNDQFFSIVLQQGVAGTGYNFGELLAASLAGFVYVDTNNNGVKEAGEAGIAGVTVAFSGIDDLGNAVSAMQITAADGSYAFNNLRPGTYTLTETQPADYLDGKDTIGTQGGSTSNDQFSNIVLGSGVAGINNNFGEIPAASLSGFVYVDANNNGVKEAGEAGIAGVTIALSGTNDLGNAVRATQTTATDGSYAFNNLRPGNYTLTETQPADYLDGKDTIGTQGGSTSNDQFSNIALGTGVQGINNNFGELAGAGLNGFVYVDANNNGVKEAGEAGIAGVTITLTGTNDLGQAVNVTQTTDANGFYRFSPLRPGTYTITETQPVAYLDGKDTIGSQGGSTGNDVFFNIVLGAGVIGNDNNFGELPIAGLSGFVYVDANNNGIKDGGEAGIAGVTITLTGTDDLNQQVNLTKTTAADGSYLFAGLRAGSYTLTETQPLGYLDGKDTIGSQGGTAGNDLFTNIVLLAGVAGINNNFGELKAASLSGFVYVDANNNGVKEAGEMGIGGVTITLTGTNDLGQAVNATQTTGVDGSYSFVDLRPGTYTLTETQPANHLDGKDSLGSAGGSVSNDKFSNIVLSSGVVGSNYNFGELGMGSLSGFVYHDANNNAVKDAAEAGIGGVTVILTGINDLGQHINVSQTTAQDGSYKFVNLRPGTYFITETQPAGYLDGRDSIGSQGGAAGNDIFSGIVLQAGANGVNYNFGELLPASISGYVYVDLNDNGIKEAGETPIVNVVITLTGTNDLGIGVTLTVLTGADGFYIFNNLRPGNYTIKETQPAGFNDGKDTLGNLGGSATNDQFFVRLASGNVGTNYNFGEMLPPPLSPEPPPPLAPEPPLNKKESLVNLWSMFGYNIK